MAFYRRDDWIQNAMGQALSGALVYYCSQPANTNTNPPSPLVSVYSDSAGTAAANPQIADGFGHTVAYLAAGTYTVVYVHPQIGEIALVDQQVAQIGTVPNIQVEAPSGAINGTNTAFNLSFTPSPANSLLLFLNGILQTKGTAYTLAGSVITFTVAPSIGSVLNAQYFY
jgi:hypothetical protein